MENEVRIEARPWEPQDLIDDLQLMIDEEPDNYLNGNRTTLCMARDYLKKFFAEESLRPKGRWTENKRTMYSAAIEDNVIWFTYTCSVCSGEVMNDFLYCPNCGAKMEGLG